MSELFPTITALDWRESIRRSRAYRNEVAEQIKLHMSTNNDGWILMSERKPRNVEFPIWASTKGGNVVLYDKDESYFILECPEFATHWKPAAADIPEPPREQTQAEKDLDAYKEVSQSGSLMGWRDVWHAALAYERAEVAKLLPNAGSIVTRFGEYAESVNAIRARCGGGK